MSVAGAWGLAVSYIRRDLAINGSPQRSEFRCVVKSADGRMVVLEAVHPSAVPQKQAIIDRLDFLSTRGLSGITPYLRATNGRPIATIGGRFWQVSPFVQGLPLNRPGFECERWRGEAMAEFLIRLRQASITMPEPLLTPPFSILAYIDNLKHQISDREAKLFKNLTPVLHYIENHLAPVHDALPTAFCHGDFHPLNLIWAESQVKAVIDWEFSGVKPENYDAATLIGCVGMENPEILTGPLVMALIERLKTAAILSEKSWRALPSLTIAIRFGWLAEWLRNRDMEMIELELVYMNLLMNHADALKAVWGLPA